MVKDTANADDEKPEAWVLVLVPFGESEVPAGRRVAQLLRTAKRRHGLRCIEVSERTPDEQLQAARAEVIRLQRLVLAQAERIAGLSQRHARKLRKRRAVTRMSLRSARSDERRRRAER